MGRAGRPRPPRPRRSPRRRAAARRGWPPPRASRIGADATRAEHEARLGDERPRRGGRPRRRRGPGSRRRRGGAASGSSRASRPGAGSADLRQELLRALGQVVDAVVAVEVLERDLALALRRTRGAPGRRARSGSGPSRPTARRGTSANRARPSRSCRPSSCSSRSPGATRSSGRSSCSACRGARCRRAFPCCAAAASRSPAIACARAGKSRRTRRWRSIAESGTPAPIATSAVGRTRSRASARMRESPMTVARRLLAALHVRIEIRAAGDEGRVGAFVGLDRRASFTARGREVAERRQTHHGAALSASWSSPATFDGASPHASRRPSPRRPPHARRRPPRASARGSDRDTGRAETSPGPYAGRACPAPSPSGARWIFSGVIGNLVDPHADRVEDRVGHGRRNRQQRPLPHFLGAERAVADPGPRRGTSRPPASPSSSGSCTRGATGTCGRRCDWRPSRYAISSIMRLAEAHVDGALDLAHRRERGLMHLPTSCAIQIFGTV